MPDGFQLLNPEFLHRTSWAHQAAYFELQDEIDTTITDVNSMIAVVLVNTTSGAVNTYDVHGNQVWGVRETLNTETGVLTPTECKNNIFRSNDEAVQSTGYRGSNCITTFNEKVKLEVDAVSAKVNEMNTHFGNIALNVYRSYIGVNPMTQGEAIEALINSTYVQTNNHWLEVKPDVNALRTSLTNAINALKTTVSACFTNAYDFMNIYADLLRTQIEYCSNYGGARANVADYDKILKDIEEHKNNYPKFVW